MSTLKTDAVTAISTNGDLSLDGLGSGGVSIASTLKMTKGGDIASASPLVIDTDGNYFDVTGTTNFSAMTVEAGNFFMLQFDGALTITHGSGIELPGAANLTTAAGDRLICYATAANTVEVMSVATEAAAGGGGLTLISETSITAVSSIDITGFDDSLYSAYQLILEHVKPASEVFIQLQMSANGGSSFASTSGDYVYCGFQYNQSSALVVSQNNTTGTSIYLSTKALRNDAYGCYSVAFDILGTPSTSFTSIAGAASLTQVNGGIEAAVIGGRRTAAVLTDAVRLSMVSGNFAAQGFIRLFGLTT